ncbi:MAG: Gfo/Idh/MocA family oxidoreductase, partial [bacterium]|nr:Gfo/Idh/MocA family oxidoreductase [bacterium]
MDVGIGLIGCGVMGRVLAKLVSNRDPRLAVVALYDPDPRSVEATRATFDDVPRVHRSHQALAQDPEVDWVMIASWNCFHAEQAIAALDAGKHVFCQKPLATRLEDALALGEAWQRSDRHFVIGFTLRFAEHYRRIHERIRSGAIGRLVSFEQNETLEFNHGGYIMGDWRRLRHQAGTFLLEKCCHELDLAHWMTGSRPRRVASFGGLDVFTPQNESLIEKIGRDENGRDAYRTWPGLVGENPFTADKDILDNQVALLEFESGARATFHTNCNAGIPER